MTKGPKEVTYLEWHYSDIEKFVQDKWGVKWEGNAAMGFPHQDTYIDIDIEYGVDEDDPLKLWCDDHTFEKAKAVIEKFKAEGMSENEEYAEPGVLLLLNWLAYEELIPKGNYRILVWW